MEDRAHIKYSKKVKSYRQVKSPDDDFGYFRQSSPFLMSLYCHVGKWSNFKSMRTTLRSTPTYAMGTLKICKTKLKFSWLHWLL